MAWVLLLMGVLLSRRIVAGWTLALAVASGVSAASITLDFVDRNSYRNVHVGPVAGGIFTATSDSLSSSDATFVSSAALTTGDASATAAVTSFADWTLGADSLEVLADVTSSSSATARPAHAAIASAGTDLLLVVTITGTWNYSFSGFVTGSQYRFEGADSNYAYQTGAGFFSLLDYANGTVFDFPTPSDGSMVPFSASGSLASGTYALNVSAISLSQVFDYDDTTAATAGVHFSWSMQAVPEPDPVPETTATVVAVGVTLAGLLAVGRRRRA